MNAVSFEKIKERLSNGVVKEHGTVCALLIDGEVAAFLEGFIDKGSILVSAKIILVFFCSSQQI